MKTLIKIIALIPMIYACGDAENKVDSTNCVECVNQNAPVESSEEIKIENRNNSNLNVKPSRIEPEQSATDSQSGQAPASVTAALEG
jgi:hypothetical protein